MNITKSFLRKLIQEEVNLVLREFDPADDDPDHDDGSDEPDAYWDKRVADRDAEMRRNPPELGMKGARKRRAKHDAGRNPNPPRPKFMREEEDDMAAPRGQDPEGDARWDKEVAKRTAREKANPTEHGLEAALERYRKRRAASTEDKTQYIKGDPSKTRPGGFDYDEGEDEVYEEEKMDIKGMHLKKGRCTPGSDNYDCPKGSAQYKLAQRFKSGDIHKDNLKRGKNPHGPGKRDY